MKDTVTHREILPTGSTIQTKETRHGRIYQLFLNKEEYQAFKEEHKDNYHIHFYGGNYIYIGPNADVNPYKELPPKTQITT